MNPPRLLVGAAVLFWGWQTGLWWLAVPMALAIEARHLVRARWEVSALGFQRIADLCTWAFLIMAGYQTFSRGLPVPILPIVQWLPPVLLPIVLAQVYSSTGRIALSALMISLRGERGGRDDGATGVDLCHAYVVICALAAGAANVRDGSYFAGVVLLLLWTLWRVRPRHHPRWLWAGLAAAAIAAGHLGHVGLNRAQAWVFNIAVDYFQAEGGRTDPYRSVTDIGHIGELKLSDRIVMRVELPEGIEAPVLLHRASYDAYGSGTWVARNAAFEPLFPAGGEDTWPLARSDAPALPVRVMETFPKGNGLLGLPDASERVSGLGAANLRRNRLGSVLVERPPGAADYVAWVSPRAHARDAPTADDLRLPVGERAVLLRVAADLGLADMRPAQAVVEMRRYFQSRFRYSTYRAAGAGDAPEIGDFLERSRAGHCEYFATAAVLIARAAGIPARYATGYSVQEWSALEGRYVVRERHAHAWARVHVDGVWRDVDTTPVDWFAEESRGAAFWQPLADLGSWIAFAVRAWQADPTRDNTVLLFALVPLAGALAWRIWRSGGFGRARGTRRVAGREASSAASPFYRIESRLAAAGLGRPRQEPLGDWIERVARARGDIDAAPLRELLRLHYRLRFDPQGLEPEGANRLERGVEAWLDAHRELA